MARGPGRPAKPTSFDEAALTAARSALLDVARELRLPRVRYPAPTRREPNRTNTQPKHLDLAVLAIELSQALEWIASEHVALARELDEVTWEDVGEAFGISMQSAHHRFRGRS
jgi:hypothetical protein